MKILVTGGNGTIGSYLLREFGRRGDALTCYSRNPPLGQEADWIEGDVTDADRIRSACHGQEAVIHLAAVPGPGRATVERMMQVNVVGTVNVLEGARAAGIGKVVFASSGAASGFTFQKRKITPQYLPIDEDHPDEPHDEYGSSKLLAELACKRYSDAFRLQTICLRINHNWYIDREGAEIAVQSGWAKGLTVEELWQVRYRKVIEDPDGDWPRPGPPAPHQLLWAFTDVRDAVQAFALAIDNDEIGHDILQITGADTCSSTETGELVARHFPGVPLRLPLEGFATLVSHEKATRLLGYRPQYSWRDSDFKRWLDAASAREMP